MSQKKVLSYQGLGSARLEEFAQAARQMQQNEQPVLHEANLQPVARRHKSADLGIRHPEGLVDDLAFEDLFEFQVQTTPSCCSR